MGSELASWGAGSLSPVLHSCYLLAGCSAAQSYAQYLYCSSEAKRTYAWCELGCVVEQLLWSITWLEYHLSKLGLMLAEVRAACSWAQAWSRGASSAAAAEAGEAQWGAVLVTQICAVIALCIPASAAPADSETTQINPFETPRVLCLLRSVAIVVLIRGWWSKVMKASR